MLAEPEDLDGDALRGALSRGWGIDVASAEYLPVGWGSHHWDVLDEAGGRWFVTVDELENKRVSDAESVDDGFARLRASLLSAVALREAGCAFVVAPVPGDGGEPAVAFGGRFAVAVYPYIDGERSGWDEWTPDARAGVFGMVAAVHMAPAWVRGYALADDYGVPFRELTEAACDGWSPPESGPYTGAVARLLREHAAPLRRWLDRYDGLVALAREHSGREVLTHGEPHPGNVMRTGDGWRLIDWDTVLVAPPERDLWSIDPGDGSVLDRYAAVTGVAPLPELIELYRLGWDIKDIAYDTAHFFRPHAEGANETKSWELLCSLVRRAGDLRTCRKSSCGCGRNLNLPYFFDTSYATLSAVAHIELGNDLPGIRGLLAYRPETAAPLMAFTEELLRGDSSLSRGERELIAAYVSGGNDCEYCTASHSASAAGLLPGGAGQVEQTLAGAACDAPVSAKMRALLEIAGLVRVDGRLVSDEAVAAARAQGATDREIHDTVLIAAAFCMFNRYVDGLATPVPDDPAQYAMSAAHLIEHGYQLPR